MVVITSDNPRDERPLAIIEEVASRGRRAWERRWSTSTALGHRWCRCRRPGPAMSCLMLARATKRARTSGRISRPFDDVAVARDAPAAPSVTTGRRGWATRAGRGRMKALLIAGGVALL